MEYPAEVGNPSIEYPLPEGLQKQDIYIIEKKVTAEGLKEEMW